MPKYRIELNQLHPGQKELLTGARRYNVACMGRRFGKSLFGINRIADAIVNGKQAAWFAPNYKLLDEVWRDLRMRLSPIVTRQDSQQHRLETLTGGTLDCWTLDSPDSGRGRKYALVIIDEAAMARNIEEAWTAAIRPTLADYQGSAWFLSTPKGKNFFHTLFSRGELDPEWARWQMPTSANPYIRPEEIEAMKRELPSLVFQQEVMAQFVDFAGAVIKREWISIGEPDGKPPVVIGVDLAISTKQDADYTAIVAMSPDEGGGAFIRDAQRLRAPFHQVMEFIKQMAAKWKPSAIGIEQVQYQAAVVQELLRTTRLPVRGIRPDKDKLTRFLPLSARYEQGLVKHAPGLPGWFEDELLSFPVGEHDDGCDAAAYAFDLLAAKTVITGAKIFR